jgi:hypothetical protein
MPLLSGNSLEAAKAKQKSDGEDPAGEAKH